MVRPFYDAMLRAAYGRSGLARRVHGEAPIRILPRYRSISETGEPEVFQALKALVKPGHLILDIGANVGVYSLLMARWVGEAGRVIAFEPAPESAAALKQHLALNRLSDRVEVVESAIADRSGQTEFFAATYNGENSMNPAFGSRVVSARKVTVPVTTIDDFCAHHQIAPDLIKIDIEGYEFHAVRGALRTLAEHHPNIVMELHPAIWPQIGVDGERELAELCGRGYSSKRIGAAAWGHRLFSANS